MCQTDVRGRFERWPRYIREGEVKRGEIELRTALTYCPRYCEGHYWMGRFYQEVLPQRDLAVQHLEFLLDICPGYGRAEDVRERILELTW